MVAAQPLAGLARSWRGTVALPFIAGAVAAAGFAPWDLWPLGIAAVAVLVTLVVAAPGRRAAYAMGWWFGFGHFLFGLAWIATAFTFQTAMPAWFGWLAVAGLAAFLTTYTIALATWAASFGRGPLARTVLLAAAWIAAEIVRGFAFTGFPWNPLGAMLLPLPPLVAAAAVIGAPGLSGLVVLAAGAVAAVLRRGRGDLAFAAAVPLLLAGVAIPALLRPPLPPAAGPVVALVQANIGEGAAFADENANLSAYLELTRAAFAASPRPVAAILPEGAVAWPPEESPELRAALAAALPPGALLLFGGSSLVRDASGNLIAATNSLYAVDAQGRVAARFDKAHLVPGGEYLPLRWLAEPLGLSRVVPGTLDFVEGPGPQTLRLPGLPAFGPAICYEIIFPGAVVDGSDRPGFILTISTDAWYGPSGPPQHWAQARLRAIEEGLPVVRSTSTGVTGFIDARGDTVARLPANAPGVLVGAIPAALPPTLFARLGLIAPAALALLLGLVALGLSRIRT